MGRRAGKEQGSLPQLPDLLGLSADLTSTCLIYTEAESETLEGPWALVVLGARWLSEVHRGQVLYVSPHSRAEAGAQASGLSPVLSSHPHNVSAVRFHRGTLHPAGGFFPFC